MSQWECERGKESLSARRSRCGRPRADDGVDELDFPVPHVEYVEVGEAAGEVDERHQDPGLDVDIGRLS
jgi:hypothetical protein